MFNPICVKCGTEIIRKEVGVVFLRKMKDYDDGPAKPHSLWGCDLFGCPKCELQILINFGIAPIGYAGTANFPNQLQKIRDSFELGQRTLIEQQL